MQTSKEFHGKLEARFADAVLRTEKGFLLKTAELDNVLGWVWVVERSLLG